MSADGVTYQSVFSGLTLTTTKNGLTGGTTYYFLAAAINSVGTGTFTSPLTVATSPVPPGVPSTPVLVSSGSSFLEVSWSPPIQNGGSSITQYLLQKDDGTGTFADIYAGLQLSYNVTNLAPSTTFQFRVAAKNVAGTGTFSATAFLTTNSLSSTGR